MKKALELLSVFMWLEAVICILFAFKILFSEDIDVFPKIYICITLMFIFALLGRFFWKLSLNYEEPISTPNKKSNLNSERLEEVKGKFANVTITFDKEMPKEVLLNMNRYYSPMQAEGDIRILSESVELIKTTKNIDTFVSRFELAQRTSLTLEQAIQAGIKIPSNFTSYKELNEIKQTYAPKILKVAYEKVKEDALKLKTEKGQLNRYQKFYDFLVENDIFFEEFVEYEEILDSLNKDIESYTTSNFGG